MEKTMIPLCLLSIFSLVTFGLGSTVAAQEGDRAKNSAIDNSFNKKVSQQASKGKLTISAKDLLSQVVAEVTGVQLNKTDRGLQVILETATGGQLVPLILPEGNNLVIDVLDATLVPTGNEFREANPSPGIELVTLTKVDASSIRLTITGETKAPDAEIVPSSENLILSVTPEGPRNYRR